MQGYNQYKVPSFSSVFDYEIKYDLGFTIPHRHLPRTHLLCGRLVLSGSQMSQVFKATMSDRFRQKVIAVTRTQLRKRLRDQLQTHRIKIDTFTYLFKPYLRAGELDLIEMVATHEPKVNLVYAFKVNTPMLYDRVDVSQYINENVYIDEEEIYR